MSNRQIGLLLAVLTTAAALLARLLWPFDGLYGQDGYAYFRYAVGLWRNEPLPIFYWPAGYPLLVAPLLPVMGWSSFAGQCISILSGAAASVLTFCFTRDLLPDLAFGKISALVAGLTVALSGPLLRANLVVMSDAAALACCAAAIWAMVRYGRTGRGGWLVGAALALAWAIITRWVCGLLVLPLALYWLLIGGLHSNELRRNGLYLVAAALVGALVIIPQVLVSQKTPVALSQHQWLTAWSLAHGWQRDFTTVDGTQHFPLPVALFNSWHMLRLGVLAPLGAVWLMWQRRWAALALLGGWPLILLLFLSGIPYENTRFVLPALPALAALTGIGFGWIYGMLTAHWQKALAAAMALVLALGLAVGLRDYRQLVEAKNADLALVAWVRTQLPTDATLITFGATLTLQHYSPYDVRELYYLTPPDLDQITQQRRPTYLLLDVASIERQWVGLRPEQDFRYLEQHPGLNIVGQHGVYTLFRLRESGS